MVSTLTIYKRGCQIFAQDEEWNTIKNVLGVIIIVIFTGSLVTWILYVIGIAYEKYIIHPFFVNGLACDINLRHALICMILGMLLEVFLMSLLIILIFVFVLLSRWKQSIQIAKRELASELTETTPLNTAYVDIYT